MSTVDSAFKAELFALMAKHGASIEWDPVYYEGDSDYMRFEVKGGTLYLHMTDLQREFEAYQKNQQ